MPALPGSAAQPGHALRRAPRLCRIRLSRIVAPLRRTPLTALLDFTPSASLWLAAAAVGKACLPPTSLLATPSHLWTR
jgi:hypothetical protein